MTSIGVGAAPAARRRHGKSTLMGWLLMLPALIALGFLFAALLYLFEKSFDPFVAGAAPGVQPEGWTLEHYEKALTDSLYLESLWVTFKLAFFATIGATLLGYPVAYGIVRTNSVWRRNALIMLVAVPFLTNLVVRLYALTLIMSNTGLINTVLRSTGVMAENDIVPMLRTELGVAIGLVYFVLPFVVFTLVSALRRLDGALEEAAMILGADRTTTFLRVTLPLSMPGVIGAATLAFILSVSAFTTPLIIGANAVAMIANTIYDQVLFVSNIPFGAALAVIALVITVALLFAQTRLAGGQRDA